MASCNTNNQPTTQSSRGYIYDTILKIDQLQKEATIQNACEGCEGSLMSTLYNTKPVSFYLCGGTPFSVTVPTTTNTTPYFRIEEVRNDSVILRILVANGDTFDCTSYTAILGIGCVCGMQCFPPICCDQCTRNCGQ